jgi:hypothetical protein
MIFKGLCIIPKKHERNHIEWLHAKHIFWFWWNLIIFGEKVLWKTIIIAIEACVEIDISKKIIKWFIMNGIYNIS